MSLARFLNPKNDGMITYKAYQGQKKLCFVFTAPHVIHVYNIYWAYDTYLVLTN